MPVAATGVTDLVTGGSGGIRGVISEADWEVCLLEASDHQSTAIAVRIAGP